MCPLYNQETGEIEGWIADAPADPVAASANYVVVAQAIAARNVMVSLRHSREAFVLELAYSKKHMERSC